MMLVDASGRFLSQREFPVMAALETEIDADVLSVSSPAGTISIARTEDRSVNTEMTVQVWSSKVRASVYDDHVNQFFSNALGTDCRLVTMTARKRPVNYWYRIHKDDNVSFADGYPFLLAGESSLSE